ncbi:hypothetical protein ACS5PU_21205 [Pedobacter sp. GSP4]|uniref:hypothetical protein n=1 Tax=Pedobacter sp. GSP4 TaxID=3453716 RepID=UPI003EEA5647
MKRINDLKASKKTAFVFRRKVQFILLAETGDPTTTTMTAMTTATTHNDCNQLVSKPL